MFFISNLFVTFFYIGRFPFAPGTLGSLVGVVLWYYLISINLLFLILFFIIFFILSFMLTNIYLKSSNSDDPSEVICDEIIGQLIPLSIISITDDTYLILIAFISFRIFDIFKFYPSNKAEELPGASGVILDDVIAGIYSLIIVFISKYFLHL
ncbi:phosphatidylglycerophosphatase A [Pelagibacterales bacterium]|nr:phosphatidylglycerophosphatase A [Pelagibacterales bacterium]